MFQTEDGGIHRNIYLNAVDLGFSFRLRTAQRTFSYTDKRPVIYVSGTRNTIKCRQRARVTQAKDLFHY